MIFTQKQKRAAQTSRRAQTLRKLHIVPAVLHGRIFDGEFEAQNATYRFNFVPTGVEISDNALVMRGRVGIESPRGVARFAEDVRATLAGTQGGVGISPIRRQLLTGTAQTSNISTSEQKLEQEAGPQTEIQPGLHSFEKSKTDEFGRPVTESTGKLAFVGVLYFHLPPLDAAALGVPVDLSRVQLNARLVPTDDLARDLQNAFSDLIVALYGEERNVRAANEHLRTLNLLFKG